MAHAQLPIVRRRFGETMRKDWWWLQPVTVFLLLSTFICYATWAAFQGEHYTYGPYLSPFYSPELFGDSPHAWFGPRPAWWPTWLVFSPALLILPFPGLFRLTCYYYRGAYYKAFWADPPACAVGEPRETYCGEAAFPAHRAEHPSLFPLHRAALSAGAPLRRLPGAVVYRPRNGTDLIRHRSRNPRARRPTWSSSADIRLAAIPCVTSSAAIWTSSPGHPYAAGSTIAPAASTGPICGGRGSASSRCPLRICM